MKGTSVGWLTRDRGHDILEAQMCIWHQKNNQSSSQQRDDRDCASRAAGGTRRFDNFFHAVQSELCLFVDSDYGSCFSSGSGTMHYVNTAEMRQEKIDAQK